MANGAAAKTFPFLQNRKKKFLVGKNLLTRVLHQKLIFLKAGLGRHYSNRGVGKRGSDGLEEPPPPFWRQISYISYIKC